MPQLSLRPLFLNICFQMAQPFQQSRRKGRLGFARVTKSSDKSQKPGKTWLWFPPPQFSLVAHWMKDWLRRWFWGVRWAGLIKQTCTVSGLVKQEVQQVLLGCSRESCVVCDKGRLCVHWERCSHLFLKHSLNRTNWKTKMVLTGEYSTSLPWRWSGFSSALLCNVVFAYMYLCVRETLGCLSSLFCLHVQRERLTKMLNVTSQSIVRQVLPFNASTKSTNYIT